MKISEKELVANFKSFLFSKELVIENLSHFDGDNDSRLADIHLVIDVNNWQLSSFSKIYIEAKTHHTKDSANTINKIFGQLLKETGKRTIDPENECYGILFPSESSTWIDGKGKTENRPGGLNYYRKGFSRINEKIFKKYGKLVGVKYVFCFSSSDKKLDIYEWDNFLDINVAATQSLTIA